MEQQVKTILGEYAFSVAALQHQVLTLTKEIEDLKKKEKK